LAGHGVAEIARHAAQQLEKFDRKPILIGHSFGGLLVQNLLGRDLAVAAIAIDPAPIKGVPELPVSALKAAFPVLRNPFNFKRAVSLTEAQFRYGFANAVSSAETELKEFPGRGHSLVIDSGWRDLAEYSLAWLRSKRF
jgi:non-heme chloroperoxidase